MAEDSGSEPSVDLWQALGQIVPYVETQDTLATALATAIFDTVGTGWVAVILPSQPLASLPSSEPAVTTYFLRRVSSDTSPGSPVYIQATQGILASLPRLNEPLYLCAPWPPTHDHAIDPLLHLAQTCLVLAPIPGHGREPGRETRGAICLFDVPKERWPSPGQLASLAAFAGVSLNLLESKNQGLRQSVEYNIISEISRSLTSSLSLDEIFGRMFTSVRAALGASAISVGLVDRETQEVIFDPALMGPRLSQLSPLRLKLGQGVAGWVARTGRPLNVPDAYSDPRFFPGVDAASGFVTRSILCVPLTVEGEVIGVLEVMNKETGSFTEEDERFLTAIGASAAIAIEKAHLHANVLADKRRMEAIFATMGEGLLTVAPDGRITAINPTLRLVLGSGAPDPIGMDCRGVISTDPNELERLLAEVQSNSSREGAFHAACDILRQDGLRIPVLISGSAILNAAGEPAELVFVFSDIRTLRELERMKEDFVTNVTHELRTPLASILLYARLLRAGKAKGDPERESRYLAVIEQQSDQLQSLVREILDLSRMEATLPFSSSEGVRIHSLFVELLGPLRKIAGQKGIAITSEVPPDIPTVVGNQDLLQLVFRNLIDNAIKFTHEGCIQITAAWDEERVQVDIKDSGIGIPPESLPYLFQRFYRTQAAVEQGIGGTGLGLALVREAMEKVGGQVDVRSQPGKGSTFTVMLPRAESV